jgi:hypothetical protein
VHHVTVTYKIIKKNETQEKHSGVALSNTRMRISVKIKKDIQNIKDT